MDKRCEDAVNKAAGRNLSDDEIKAIEDNIVSAHRSLSMRDANFMQMSKTERYTAAAQLAGKWALDAHKKRQITAIRDAATKLRNQRLLDSVAPSGEGASHKFLLGRLQRTTENSDAIYRNWLRNAIGLDQAYKGKFLSFVHDPANDLDLARALTNDPNASADAINAAKVLRPILDSAHARLNEAGFDVNYLEHYLPIGWDRWKVSGRVDEAVSDAMAHIDPRAFVTLTGERMDAAGAKEFLRHAFTAISTDGASRVAQGKGTNFSRFGAMPSRQLFWKNADSMIYMLRKYGRSANVLKNIDGYLKSSARKIAIRDELGGDPDEAHKQLSALATTKEAEALNKRKLPEAKRVKALATLKKHEDDLKGFYQSYVHPDKPGNERIAYWGDQVRGLIAATQLTGAPGTISDYGNLFALASHYDLPSGKILKQIVKNITPNKERKEFLQKAGLATNILSHELTRYMHDDLNSGFGTMLAAKTHKLSLIDASDSLLTKSPGIVQLHMLANFTRDFQDVHEAIGESRLVKEAGIDQELWNVWRAAKPESAPGDELPLLTPQSIYDVADKDLDKAIAGRLSVVKSIHKDEKALYEAVARERLRAKNEAAEALMRLVHTVNQRIVRGATGGSTYERYKRFNKTDPGSYTGQFMRFFWQFSSIPVAILQNAWRAAKELDGVGSRVAFATKFAAYTLATGALATQISALINGEDPISVNPTTPEGRSHLWEIVTRSGLLGIYSGLAQQVGYGTSLFGAVGGPAFHILDQIVNFVSQDENRLSTGSQSRSPHPYLEQAAKIARQTAAPFSNIFYVKAVINHLLYDNLLEQLHPGHIQQTIDNAAKHNITYWFQPGG